MKITLIGYGKMGQLIERIAQERGHTISVVLDSKSDFSMMHKGNTDIAIEFTRPESAVGNIRRCVEHGIPVVVGTTGWNKDLDQTKIFVKEHKGSMLYASNFSVGVNVFFELNKVLARLMSQLPAYKASIEEIHHVHKLDAPSGTAITIAEHVIEQHSRYTGWKLAANENESSNSNTLPIEALRIPEIPGTHSVKYTSSIDAITLTHEAFNREGFAMGAVIAAEWLLGKTGVFTMQDVLNISKN